MVSAIFSFFWRGGLIAVVVVVVVVVVVLIHCSAGEDGSGSIRWKWHTQEGKSNAPRDHSRCYTNRKWSMRLICSGYNGFLLFLLLLF